MSAPDRSRVRLRGGCLVHATEPYPASRRDLLQTACQAWVVDPASDGNHWQPAGAEVTCRHCERALARPTTPTSPEKP